MDEFNISYNHIKIVHDNVDLENQFRELLYDYYALVELIRCKGNPSAHERSILKKFNNKFQLHSSLKSGNELTNDDNFNILEKLTMTHIEYENVTASAYYAIRRDDLRPIYTADMFLELIVEAFDKLSFEEISKMYEFNCHVTNYNNLYLLTIKQL